MSVNVLKRVMLNSASLLLHFAHGGFVVTGVLVAAYLTYGISRYGIDGPWFAGPLRGDEVALEQAAAMDEALAEPELMPASNARLSPANQRVVAYLAHRYKVSSAGVEPLVISAEQVGRKVGMDPLLLVAVMAVESSFNPIAESPMGAQGLMQVIPRFHQEKISEHGDGASLLDPETNIAVGALVLKEYLARTGSLEGALQFYNGASNDASAVYANKVLAEKQRLEAVAQRKPLPMATPVRTAAPAVRPAGDAPSAAVAIAPLAANSAGEREANGARVD